MSGYEASLGTVLIGALVNTFLYGIVTNQYAVYYQRFNSQQWLRNYPQIIVVVRLSLGYSMQCSVLHVVVRLEAGLTCIRLPLQPYEVFPATTACSAFVTQIFLTWRIWRLTQHKLIVTISAFLALASLGFGIACGIKSTVSQIAGGQSLYKAVITRMAWMISQVVADLFITTRTGIKRTDNIIYRLIRGAVQTGVIAVLFALASLVSYLAWPETNTLYNSLLSREDAREGLGLRRDGVTTMDNKGLSTARHAQFTTAITITVPDLENHDAENPDNTGTDDSEVTVSAREGV
ncbi:hypothetical protein CONPUDRAFT_144934 [Coniophora puteana RWD-64-598 SS2]|uniref:Uncharacterized protein n=1 Tax=Coniophora puteana (strain RWD-64-598) TaxID=741705 RepID=A0A5M3MKT8_CONPW|nr:uncharacterized protein CONPUDRAFT_144934 [Coniophora puteana RWD-64-598 SS2]EIW79778.1 hypothetical protein CONPUDRAFT_144934 [Coniophora puteana RWD-64-598 SS2]